MENRGNRTRQRNAPATTYSSDQIEAVLNSIGVEIVAETVHDFLCYCPYHGNKFTPSFSVSNSHGSFICYNHACGVSGNLLDLVTFVAKVSYYEGLRIIDKAGKSDVSFKERMERRRKKMEFPSFPPEVLERMQKEFWNDSEGLEYMLSRGFERDTLREFGIGYSATKNMVATPMYDIAGNPIGVIGRSPSREDKQFKNSVGLPTSQTLWNIHRARKFSDAAIVCEANFDGMRISQAGYPNVVACLGGNFSPNHAEQLDQNFSTIIIATDFDDKEKHIYKGCRKCRDRGFEWCQGHNPGRALGNTIAEEMSRRGKVIKWAAWGNGVVYPHGAKDVGDLTDEEIKHCIQNAVSNYIYRSWNIPA